jgi:hypothetical protein
MISRIRSTVDSLQGKRAGISPSVDIFLEEHGDEPIQQLVISMVPPGPARYLERKTL